MVLNGFDSVDAIPIGNFTRRRKLKWLFEFSVFLFLVSRRSTWFSFADPVLRHFFRRLVAVLNSHIFVFMFFNVMLFVVYSLSGLTETKPASNRTDAAPSHGTAAGDSPEGLVASSDDSVAEKNAVTSPVDGVAIAATPAAEEPTEDMPSPSPPSISPVPHSTETADGPTEQMPSPSPPSISLVPHSTETAEEIIPETKQYRRTESERFEERREENKFRRSKTEIRRESSEEPARLLRSVHEMDINDFNRTVESFIAEQKLHIGRWISD